MELKIGRMIEVDGEFGNIVGLEGDMALVFMLRRGETVPVNTSRIKGIEAEAAEPKQNTGEPAEPKSAADTAIRLWSMGYRGQHLLDQMAELGFSKSESEKAVEAAQTEYRARREDGGGYWEIQKGERLKLANGEWCESIEAERDGSVGVEFSDGNRELVLVSDLDDKFMAGRSLIGRLDRLIRMVEASMGRDADQEIEISYKTPGGNRERKRFRNQQEMGEFVKSLEQQHGSGKVEIEIDSGRRMADVAIFYEVKGRTGLPKTKAVFKTEQDALDFIAKQEEMWGRGNVKYEWAKPSGMRSAAEPVLRPDQPLPQRFGPVPKTPIKVKVEEPGEKGLRETLEEKMRKDLVEPLESSLEPVAQSVVDMELRMREADQMLTELKAKRDKYWAEIGGPAVEQARSEEFAKFQKMYMELMDLMAKCEGKIEDGDEILRRWNNIVFRIKAALREEGGKFVFEPGAKPAIELLLIELSLDPKFSAKALNQVYEYSQKVLDSVEHLKQGTEAFLQLTPSAYRPTKWSASLTAGLWEKAKQLVKNAWDSIMALGRSLRGALDGTGRVEELVEQLEEASERGAQRGAARMAILPARRRA